MSQRVCKKTILFLFSPLFFSYQIGVRAWGEYGHQQVADAAINLLPTSGKDAKLSKCFISARDTMRRLAITPDLDWKNFPGKIAVSDPKLETKLWKERITNNDPNEHSLHFDEVDAYAPNPGPGEISKLPSGPFLDVFSDYKQKLFMNAAFVFKIDSTKAIHNPMIVNDVTEHGTAPWRVVQLYQLAVDAIKAGDLQKYMYYIGALAHYVGDMAQPLHASLDFDGGFPPDKPGEGVHAAIDTGVLPGTETGFKHDNYSTYPNFAPTEADVMAEAKEIFTKPSLQNLKGDGIVQAILEMIDEGYPLAQKFTSEFQDLCSQANKTKGSLYYCKSEPRPEAALPPALAPDIISSRALVEAKQAEAESSVRKLPEEYFKKYTDDVLPDVKRRLGDGAGRLAHIWLAAYEEAGSPELGDCGSLGTFNDDWLAYTIENYPKPNDASAHGYMPEGWVPTELASPHKIKQ